MSVQFDTLAALSAHGFDTLIDVRSPAEFAEDHVPGAINLPALSNDQRAQVGTIYKQVSPFDARKIGAAMVARNVADHVDGPLAQKDGAWRPLVYCWRGGQRSGSFATILSQIGWRAETIQGGYQSYRRLVQGYLYKDAVPHQLILLDGNTGTAKTDLLAVLDKHGVQSIDLEALARHRGSLLGEMPGGQPSQRWFETTLAMALLSLDPVRPVIVEAESSKIGELNIPPSLWARMLAAPRISVEAPLAARADYLVTTYADIIADPARLRARLALLRRLRGHAVVDRWNDMLDAGDLRGLAAALMQEHYDPAYATSRRIDTRDVLGTIAMDALDAKGLARTAGAIVALLDAPQVKTRICGASPDS